MSLTHVTALRNALADLVVDAIDVGATDASGDLQLGTAAFAIILATLTFANPAFGVASGGIATAAAITADLAAAGGGSAVVFKIRDRNNAEVLRGSVTATGGGGDVQLSSTTINTNDTVSITSMTYAASA